jgi:hypothetical protein
MTTPQVHEDIVVDPALLRAEFEARKAALQRDLSPAHFDLVWQLVLLEEERTGAERGCYGQALIDELARHFPDLGPAIRMVGSHILEARPDEVGRCCAPGGDDPT